MKVSTLLALAASVIVTVGIMIVETTQGVSDEEFVWDFAMIGAVLLTGSDIVARVALSPQELPIGIVTSSV